MDETTDEITHLLSPSKCPNPRCRCITKLNPKLHGASEASLKPRTLPFPVLSDLLVQLMVDGRANVGKSSLLSVVLGRMDLLQTRVGGPGYGGKGR